MEYTVIADHDLAIDGNAFRATWNTEKRFAAVAAASAAGDVSQQTYDGGLTLILGILGGIATGVVSNLLTDMVKEAIDTAAAPRKLEYDIVIVEKNDGSRIIRVRKK